MCEIIASLYPIRHFQVAPNLCFDSRLSSKPMIWKWFCIPMPNLIFTRKVLHQASFWKWEFSELGNGLLRPMITIKRGSFYRRLRTGRKVTIFRQIVFTSETKKISTSPAPRPPPMKGWFFYRFSPATWAGAQHCLGEGRKGSLLFPLWRKQYWQNVENVVEDNVSLLFLLLTNPRLYCTSFQVSDVASNHLYTYRKIAWSKIAGIKTMAMPLSTGSSVWRVPGMGAYGRVAGICHGGGFHLGAGWP